MNLLTTILLALGMSVDAFAAALARGAGSLHYTWRQTVKTALIFGIVETITPLIGWLVGSMTQKFIAEYDHWLAFGLLLALGLKMIWGALHDDGDEAAAADKNRTDTTLLLTVITAIATSIDSMVVGVGLAFLDANIWLTALAIGTSTTIMAAVGRRLGRLLGQKIGSRAEMAGGVVLIGIGTFILLEHLGYLNV